MSILVAAWNEHRSIRSHIESVLGLDYPQMQYVLCAGGTDATYDLAAQALGGRGILLRQEPGEGKQRALRRCLAEATGEVIYLTDADCVIETADFERVLEPILEGAGAATGRSRPFDHELEDRPSVLCQWAPQYVSESSLGELSPGLLGRNCAVLRDELLRAGGFAADVPTGTDYHLARQLARARVPIAFSRWSFVRTAFPKDVAGYVRQQSRWLRNHWLHGRPTGDRAAQMHAARGWLVGGSVAAMPLLFPLVGRTVLWLWAALLVHGGLARVRYVAFVTTAEGLRWNMRALLLSPLWFVSDACAWAKSLLDQLRRSTRHRW